jgi:hypothetical protein
MAVKKDPSIYDDRSTIGSSNELDEYGVWVKVAPQDLVNDQAPDEEPIPIMERTSDDFDSGIPLEESIAGDISFEDLSLEDESDFTEDISDLIDVDDDDVDFDNLEALRQDMVIPGDSSADETADLLKELPDVLPEAVPERGDPIGESPLRAGIGGGSDISTQLLMKIADELASIKSELSSLKSELSVLHSEKAAESGAEKGTGYFDGEDDDKIALTGDELNNILHTADFTEETGTDAGESLGDNFEDTFDIPGENSTETPPEISASSDVPADTSDIPPDAIAALETGDTEDLKALRESGVEPMTPPPEDEDTNYLAEDPLGAPLAEDVLASELLDLSDVIIDEPDRSEGIKETAPEEPSPGLITPVDSLSLIDLETMSAVSDETEKAEDTPPVEAPLFEEVSEETFLEEVSEKTLFEEVSFDELASEGESIDLSTIEDAVVESEPEAPPFTEASFEDPVSNADIDADDQAALEIPDEDLSLEILNEDTALPVEDNDRTEDPFESLSLDEAVEETADAADEEKVEPDLPPLDLAVDEIDETGSDSPDIEDTAAIDALNIDHDPLPDITLPDDLSVEIPAEEIPVEEISVEPDSAMAIPPGIKKELINVLAYMDKLLESLPEEKIAEFAQSEHYTTYKKLFDELGIE